MSGIRDEEPEGLIYTQILNHCPNNKPRSHGRNDSRRDGDDDDDEEEATTSNSNNRPSSSSSTWFADNEPLLTVNDDAVVYTICGYEFSWTRFLLFHIVALLPFCGLPHLLALWFPRIHCWKYKRECLRSADHVLVTNNFGLVQMLPSTPVPIPMLSNGDHCIVRGSARLFTFEGVRYVYSRRLLRFTALTMPHEGRRIEEFFREDFVPNSRYHADLLELYGPNEIRVDVKSYWRLFVEEIVNPFYLFQLFSITLWSLDDYYYYAACVLTLSAISIGTSLYQTRKQSLTLRQIVEQSHSSTVETIHDYDQPIASLLLIPGMVIKVTNGLYLPCDCVLLSGSSIVNECMLTGESVPVNKVALDQKDSQVFSESRYRRSVLYAGTEVILARGDAFARVLNTGFSTAKGQLIRSILHPKPIGFKFYKDSVRFVLLLFCCALFGMLYAVRLYLRRNQDLHTMIFGTLDVITIIVPPSLPMAMTAGTIYSQSRLKNKGVFCVSPPQINVCGKMKLCCFDKTGTLTEDGLTYRGHLNVGLHGRINEELKSQSPLNLFDKFLQGMATCHSLIRHEEQLIGDPLDVELFAATNWTLSYDLRSNESSEQAAKMVRPSGEQENSTELPYIIYIYKDYEFTSERQCMSVLVKVLGHQNYLLFAKGAPEKIRQMVMEKSLPSNFDTVLGRYAMQGYRVLALAYREFPAKLKFNDLKGRKAEALERDLTFLGFLVFENKLKPETLPTVRELKHEGGLRVVMATGDNILTAVSVARESGIVEETEKIFKLEFNEPRRRLIALEVGKQVETGRRTSNSSRLQGRETNSSSRRQEENVNERTSLLVSMADEDKFPHHFAMDGGTWEAVRRVRPELIPKILTRGTIFARFRPEQKSELVQGLQDMDYIVTMCGDGANDCTALKAANIGVSLSQAEASVAAPFTYNKQNIECVKYLALEGRCALVTSFAIFKYMILYSVIQFCTVLILYTYCTTLGNFQFLYIDLIITASIAFSMGLQEPTKRLVPQRPSSSLISPNNVIPLVIQIAICVSLQIGAMFLLAEQQWYPSGELEERCTVNDTARMPWLDGGAGGGLFGAERTVVCWENTVVFLTSCFQYLALGLMYSKGRPFRKPFYTNITFVAIFLSLTTFTLILLLQPPEQLAKFFELESLWDSTEEENAFRYFLLLFPLGHIVAAMVVELGIADRAWLKRVVHVITRKRMPRNKFKMLDNGFQVDPTWIEFKAGED